MKKLSLLLLPTLLSLQVQAQPGRRGDMGMGATPQGPGLSGSTAKLFGDNTSFSANLEMQTSSGEKSETMTMPGKIAFDQGKSRFDMDLSQVKGGMMSPETAA